nr:MAG TPA: hypothetical protein [Caudoviricetes sp.]
MLMICQRSRSTKRNDAVFFDLSRFICTMV